jgi:hypothetical protein
MKISLKQALLGVFVFTLIEYIGLNQWFSGSVPAVAFSAAGQVKMFVILYVEHFVSLVVGLNVGAGRPFLANPFATPTAPAAPLA